MGHLSQITEWKSEDNQEEAQPYSSPIIVKASTTNLIFLRNGVLGPVRMVDIQEEGEVEVLKWNIYLRVGNICASIRNRRVRNAEGPALKG